MYNTIIKQSSNITRNLSLVLQKRPLERGMYYIHGFDWPYFENEYKTHNQKF